ncbi:hypothetical protein BLNAU_21483 [Blattamonas nauphoetae]|uniref:Uncharacterized protein n=1 Tax=Blattamonas nauphoetae TaxID=2049346 RepID=A0ABQ9WWA1_9EUKA|nr:hypothetical protein BLNAU_21483 [Blattamonas nauphoetae]
MTRLLIDISRSQSIVFPISLRTAWRTGNRRKARCHCLCGLKVVHHSSTVFGVFAEFGRSRLSHFAAIRYVSDSISVIYSMLLSHPIIDKVRFPQFRHQHLTNIILVSTQT